MSPSKDIRVLLLERNTSDITDDAVFGNLYINGVFYCNTLENLKTLVPQGLYDVAYNNSPKFGRKLPMFFNNFDCKPERGLRMHAGNSKDDSQGCILLGERYYKANYISNKIKNSKATVERLCDLFETDGKPNRTILIIGSLY